MISLYQTVGGFLTFVADGAQDLADELVVGLVGGDRFANPVVEGEGAVGPAGLVPPLDAQDVGPLVGEVVAVFGRLEQCVDQLVALGRVLVGHERHDLLGVGSVPVMSSDTRRMNCSSAQSPTGTSPSSCHFFFEPT